MTSSKNRLARLSLFGSVYFLQGAVMTYLSAFNVLYMRTFDIPFSIIGIVGGIAMVPFILKIFIGLLSDRVNLLNWGHRKPYIILGIIVQSLAFILLTIYTPDNHLTMYIFSMVLVALGMSTYDTTTDGFSIDTTPPEDRGLVQGLMVGGRSISMVITATLMGFFANKGNWNYIFLMATILGLVTLLFAFLVKEDKVRKPEVQLSKVAFTAFKDKSLLLFILMGFIYPLALYSAEGMISPFLNEEMGVSLTQVGYYTGVFGLGTFFGAITGGPLMKRIGERSSLIVALVITTAVTLLLAFAYSPVFMWFVVFMFGVAFGFYSTAYFAMGMEFADPRIAAFMFSVIMAVGNFAIAAGTSLAGVLVDAFGFRVLFLIFAGVHLLVLPIILQIFNIKGKNKVVILTNAD